LDCEASNSAEEWTRKGPLRLEVFGKEISESSVLTIMGITDFVVFWFLEVLQLQFQDTLLGISGHQ